MTIEELKAEFPALAKVEENLTEVKHHLSQPQREMDHTRFYLNELVKATAALKQEVRWSYAKSLETKRSNPDAGTHPYDWA